MHKDSPAPGRGGLSPSSSRTLPIQLATNVDIEAPRAVSKCTEQRATLDSGRRPRHTPSIPLRVPRNHPRANETRPGRALTSAPVTAMAPSSAHTAGWSPIMQQTVVSKPDLD